MPANIDSHARDEDIYPFLSNVTAMRRRAREHIEQGGQAPDPDSERDTVVRLLNEALANKRMCVLRHRHQSAMADGPAAATVKGEFMRHALKEQSHVDRLAERILELGGAPDLTPQGLAMGEPAEYLEGESLLDMLEEDLVAERVAIESYREILQYLSTKDATSQQLLENILAFEAAQAEELATLRVDIMRQDRTAASAA
jgi:bacterioferritin